MGWALNLQSFGQDYTQYTALQHRLSKVICGADIPYPNI